MFIEFIQWHSCLNIERKWHLRDVALGFLIPTFAFPIFSFVHFVSFISIAILRLRPLYFLTMDA